MYDGGCANIEAQGVHKLVTTISADERRTREEVAAVEDLPIYKKLPDGLIDLPSAAQKYCKPRATLNTWARREYVRVVGRLYAPAPGGGYLVFRESELQAYMASEKNRGGRPRQT